MKRLEPIAFDYAACRQQVEEFRTLLTNKDDLSERDDVLPFFKARRHAAVLFGMFNPRIAWADRIADEFDIFGDFACDLVVGEWERGAYCFVEFEDATGNSIFEKQGKKATREWARRFDHGCSQIIDWVHKIDDRKDSADMLARFGLHEINYETVLVVGRDKHLDAGEKQRLAWRAENVVVGSKKIICMTFDELLSQFVTRLRILDAVDTAAKAQAQAQQQTGPPPPTSP